VFIENNNNNNNDDDDDDDDDDDGLFKCEIVMKKSVTTI